NLATHGAIGVDVHRTSRSQSGAGEFGVLFQLNRQFSGYVKLPRQSSVLATGSPRLLRHSLTSMVLLVPSVMSVIRSLLLTMKTPGLFTDVLGSAVGRLTAGPRPLLAR